MLSSLPLLSTAATLELRATSLKRALPLIGAQYDLRMRAAPSIEEEIVIARLSHAPLDETKTHLAKAFAGEWRTSADGTLELWPDKERREADRREWIEARRLVLSRQLATLAQEREKLPQFDMGAALSLDRRVRERGDDRENAVGDPTPARRMLLRLAALVRPDKVIDDDPDPRAVYSLTPTDAQHSLGTEGASAFDEYQSDFDLWRSVRPLPPIRDQLFEDRPDHEMPGTPARVLFIVAPEERYTFRLLVFDRRGVAVECALVSREEPEQPRDKAPNFRYDVPQEDLTERGFLNDEPLAGDASAVLLDVARRAGRSMIVAPPDDLVRRKRVTSGGLREWLASPFAEISTGDQGWLTIIPEAPYVTRATFFPRDRLQKLRRTLIKGDRTTLAEWFEYGRLSPTWPDETPGVRFLRLDLPVYVTHPGPQQIGAALSSSEWQAATRAAIPVGALNPKARALAASEFYDKYPWDGHHGQPWPRFYWRWEWEPTNHAMASLTLRLKPDEETLGGYVGSERPYLVSASLLLDAVKEAKASDRHRVRFFTRRSWDLTIGTTDRFGPFDPNSERSTPEWYGLLRDAAEPLDARTYALNEIPAPILRRLQAQRNR